MNTSLKPSKDFHHRLIAVLLSASLLLCTSPCAAFAAITSKAVVPPPAMPKQHKKADHKVAAKSIATKRQFKLSSDPSDQEIIKSKAFRLLMCPMHSSPVPGENKALAAALNEYKQYNDAEKDAPLVEFVKTYPSSRWHAAVLSALGDLHLKTGHISQSLSDWSTAWNESKMETATIQKAVADHAISQLALLRAKLGQIDELEQLFTSIKGRKLLGSAESAVRDAQKGLSCQKKVPEISFKCGPFALDAVLSVEKGKPTHSPVILKAASTEKGTSLAQVKKWADEIGLDYQIAKRDVGAPLIVPAVMHYKLSHFCALTKREGDHVMAVDRTFGRAGQMLLAQSTIDEESDGYFLVPNNKPLPNGWHTVSASEAGNVWGRGYAGETDPPCPCQEKQAMQSSQGCSSCHGMAQADAYAMQATLSISDIPLSYHVPVGPSMDFQIAYTYQDEYEPEVFTFSNMGPDWSFSYLSYLTVDEHSNVTLRPSGGGAEVYPWDSTSDSWEIGMYSNSTLTESSGVYVLTHLDGSYEEYSLTDTNGNTFMTSMVDAQGNTVTIDYDSNFRIVGITDAIGQESTVSYGSNTEGDAGFYVITQVTDPFGRSASFSYDSTFTYLLTSTDVLGLQSQFHYQSDTSSFIDQMTTPYGTTGFYTWDLEDTVDPTSALEFIYPDGTTSVIMSVTYSNIATYFFSREVMAEYPADIVPYGEGYISTNHCTETIWCINGEVFGNQTALPYQEIQSLENATIYNYPGGSPEPDYPQYYFVQNNQGQPSSKTRTISGTTTQSWQYEYNSAGSLTQSIDPLGRTFSYSYDTNGIDLLEKQQALSSTPDINGIWSGYSNHLPTSYEDGSGQTTSYTYNSFGEVETITDPNSGVWTLNYDSNGYLTSIDGPLSGSSDVTTISYDGFGRIYQITDSEGYTLTYSYDNADRITQITYPDGTSIQKIYDKLDNVLVKDRIGRWTQQAFDSMDQKRYSLDPLGRKTQYEWCPCGGLHALIDPAGNKTSWDHDVEGRVTSKTYADGSQYTYGYDAVGRLASRLDANYQTTNYSYNLDNTLAGKSYENAINDTSDVTYSYDPDYMRLTSVENGWGTISYSYNPYITSSSATTTGAGKVSEITNSVISDSDITYSYDVLGRVTNRSINGGSNSIDWAYDAMSRVTSETNALGEFDYAYVDDASGYSRGTTRLSSINYPNGQVTHFNWFGNAKDQRLQGIVNLKSDGTCLSQFNYGYDPAGEITAWQQQQAGSNQVYALGYDRAGQLTSAKSGSYGTISPSYTSEYFYDYDKAGNRISSSQFTNTTVTVGGSPTAGDVLSITVLDSGLSGGQETVSYTVQSGDGLDDIANGLSLAINNDSNLDNLWVYANSDGAQLYVASASPDATSYQSSVSSGATENIAFGNNDDSLTNLLAVGSATVGDTITLTVNDPALSGGSESVSYTVGSGDSLTDIAVALISAVNSDSALSALPVYGTNLQSGGQLISESANTTTFTQSVSDGATEALEFSLCTNIDQQATISGTPTAGDVVTITAYDASLSGGSHATSYTVQSGDDATAVATGIANAITGDSTMSSIIESYTDGGCVATISSFSMNRTDLRATTSSGATETVVLGESVAGDYGSPNFGGTAYSYNPLNELFTTNQGGTTALEATTNKALQTASVNTAAIDIQQKAPPATNYSQPEYSSATELLTIYPEQFGSSAFVVSGTITTGDVLSVVVKNKLLQGGQTQINYTVQSTDGLDDIAAGFASAINASTALAAIGIDSESSGSTFWADQEVTTYDFSVSSDNEILYWGPNTFGNICVEVDGTPTTGDVLTITGYNPAFPGGSTTTCYTVQSGDTLYWIADNLAAAINANTSMSAIGVSATDSAPIRFEWSQKISANPPVLYSTEITMSGTDGGGNWAGSYPYPYTIYSNGNYSEPTFDANGNMTSDGTNTYAWDAENRLVQIVYPGSGNYSIFAYDSWGDNVAISEYSAGLLTSGKQFVWSESMRREARGADGSILTQYFAFGQYTSGSKYFYASDHLVSRI